MAGTDKNGKGFSFGLKGLTQWVLHWADTPYAAPMLGVLSFAESSFFPIPPDVLLIPMGASRPDRAIRFGTITTIASVLGGMFGYLIGMMFFDTVGIKIIEFYGLMDKYFLFREWFDKYNFAIIMVAGLTPLPYKVFTITAGVAGVNFPVFVLGSVVSRSVRFMAESVVCYYGDFFSDKIFKMPVRDALIKYINWFAGIMAVLGVAGFITVKLALPGSEVRIDREVALPGGRTAATAFFSTPDQADKHKRNYSLVLALEGGTVEAAIPGGPFAEPSRGDAALLDITTAAGDLVLAPVFYSDLPPPEKGTDGHMVFFLAGESGLSYLERLDFPKYRLGLDGSWSEGKVGMKAGEADDPHGFMVVVEDISHAGSKGGLDFVIEKRYRCLLDGGVLRQTGVEEKKLPPTPGGGP